MKEKISLLQELKSSQEFLNRATSELKEDDSNYSPTEGMYTTAQQLAHVAHTINWFLEGAFSSKGFDLNFQAQSDNVRKITSLMVARGLVNNAYAKLIAAFADRSEAEWAAPIVAGPIMGGEPRNSILFGILEHTAHHRGALGVYTRMRGRIPPMPYV